MGCRPTSRRQVLLRVDSALQARLNVAARVAGLSANEVATAALREYLEREPSGR
jgi:predicted HicB family RNase H-like nuclease